MNNDIKKPLNSFSIRTHAIYFVLIVVYVVLFTMQINQPPYERYPAWDWFWVDVLHAGKLICLKYALCNFELPFINPYINFGWNVAGDTTMPDSFMMPLNLLILFFSPATVIVIRTIVYFILGAFGVYLFLKLITRDDFISFFGGLIYISVPWVIGNFYYHNGLTIFLFVPLFLYAIHKIIENTSSKKMLCFIGLSFLTVSSGDVYVFIIIPAVIVIYSFLISLFYYRLSLLNSMKKTIMLLFLFLLSGAFFIIPLYNNLKMISSTTNFFKIAGVLKDSVALNVPQYIVFFKNQILGNLYKPNEGSGTLLYVPILLYFTIFLSLVFAKPIFKENFRKVVIPFTLVLLCFVMFAAGIIFYSLPDIAKLGKGVLRYHLNLIQFVIILASFICFSAISKASNLKKIFIFFILFLCSFAVDYYLFVIPHHYAESDLFNIRHELFTGIVPRSSNLLPIRFSKDVWPLLTYVNALLLFIIMLYSFFKNLYAKKIGFIIFVFSAMCVGLLSISVYNEVRLQQHRWQVTYRNPYRWNSYLKRKACIDSIVDRYDIKYRTLYCGKAIYPNSGRNFKFIAETELHVQEREKVLFCFRETMHPYTALLYEALARNNFVMRTSNLFPPISSNVSGSIELVRLMGVKYIISAEEKIDSPDLIYRGECMTEDGPCLIHGNDGGPMYIYELKDPLGIVFLADNYKKVSLYESLRTILENKVHPWVNSEVYLEEDPGEYFKSYDNKPEKHASNLGNSVEITKETFNTIVINTSSPKDKYLVVSYIYRPNWRAYIGSKELKIFRAYGGFMCVNVPAGENSIKFKYIPVDVYWGISITICAFFVPFFVQLFRRRVHRIVTT